jgi:hypothetical protein
MAKSPVHPCLACVILFDARLHIYYIIWMFEFEVIVKCARIGLKVHHRLSVVLFLSGIAADKADRMKLSQVT